MELKMLNRSQLLLLTIMATLGGSFAGFLAVGIAMGDITLALINLGVIVALFSCAFVISGQGTKKLDCIPSEEAIKYFHGQAYENHRKRAGDIHVGGELNPEFKN